MKVFYEIMKPLFSLSVLTFIVQVIGVVLCVAIGDASNEQPPVNIQCSDDSPPGSLLHPDASSNCEQHNLIASSPYPGSVLPEMMNDQSGRMQLCVRPERSRPPIALSKTEFLSVLENVLNLPNGALGKIPLCSTKDLFPNGNFPKGQLPVCKLSMTQLKNLLALLTPKPGVIPPHILPYPFCPCPIKPTPPIFIPPRPPICPPQLPCDCCFPSPHIPISPNPYPTPDWICKNQNFPIGVNPDDNIVRQIPVVQKILRSVVETRTKHIPVIRKRLRTVVEPYTSHIPVLEKFTRPIEDTVIRTVPVCQNRLKPVIAQNLPNIQLLSPDQMLAKQCLDCGHCPPHSPIANHCLPQSEIPSPVYSYQSDTSSSELSSNYPHFVQQISPQTLRCPSPCS